MTDPIAPPPQFPSPPTEFPDWPEWPSLCVTGPVEVTDGPIEFTPVPRRRVRRGGWSAETQRAFIDALAQCGCVAAAARSVGLTSRSAYRLLDAEGADSFAAAWDQAIARGVEALQLGALDRALNGAWVPVVRRGKLVRMERRYNDRLAIALLSGRDHSVASSRELATSRRRYRAQLAEQRRKEEEEQRHAEEIWALHQAHIDRPTRARPRVRGL